MSDNEFNANEQNRRNKRRRRERPPGLYNWEWEAEKQVLKNRHFVGVKLTPANWHAFETYKKIHNLNNSSGLNRLVATHPDLQNHA